MEINAVPVILVTVIGGIVGFFWGLIVLTSRPLEIPNKRPQYIGILCLLSLVCGLSYWLFSAKVEPIKYDITEQLPVIELKSGGNTCQIIKLPDSMGGHILNLTEKFGVIINQKTITVKRPVKVYNYLYFPDMPRYQIFLEAENGSVGDNQ